MKYGCIGEHLKHSFSKEIHGLIADYDYVIREIPRDGVDEFMKTADFLAINVTIPYKETVIPYLDSIDKEAELIGAVNTIVKRDGKLFGYNTDFFGMSMLAKMNGIDLKAKKVLILGTGGTSKTALAVAKSQGAREIIKVSRHPSADTISYDDMYSYHTDADVIINTTPVGMYPNIFESPIDISAFNNLSGVLDAVYNPLSTKLISDAKRRGIPASGGLYMLVAQGVLASEHFLGTSYRESICDEVYAKILADKKNIVLIGMPASGKSTVGHIIANELSREFIDTDDLIVEYAGIPITEIFARYGEEEFRRIEERVIMDVSSRSGVVIATGGGAILRSCNVDALKMNGDLYFIDRPLSALIPTSDRPTASSTADITKRYLERIDIYRGSADQIIPADIPAESVARRIIESAYPLK